jgi:AcrR family transcriptional regulator
MARTQAADYDERRAAIVEAAAALFADAGFEGTSVADIAQRCGVSKSLIYHYYDAKEDILYDAMISHVRALDAAAREAMAGGGGSEQKLRTLARAFVALYVGAAARHRVLLNDLKRVPKPRRAEIVTVQRGLIEIVRTLLIAIEPRLSGRADSTAAAMLFFGAINWIHTWYDADGAIAPDVLADMSVDLALGGVSRIAMGLAD